MSGFDKAILEEKLISSGWKNIAGESEEPKMVPPESLWQNKPEYFSLYDARDLEIDLMPRPEPDFVCSECKEPTDKEEVCFADGKPYCFDCAEWISQMNHERFGK